MYCVIPVKTNSSRCPSKNIRPFAENGDSLFDITAKQVLNCFNPNDVYVSSENPEVVPLCAKYGFQFLERPVYLTDNKVPFGELMTHVEQSLPDDNLDIAWVHVTHPLFGNYTDVLQTWYSVKKDHDSLLVARRVYEHIIDERGMPVNFQCGAWHKATQYLPTWYECNFHCCLLFRETLRKYGYFFGVSPYVYEDTGIPVNIDTEDDFAFSQLVYKRFSSNKI